MAEEKDACVKPARGPIMAAQKQEITSKGSESQKEAVSMMARVGGEAIDFEANAYVAREGFKTVKLSDYKGKWIVLCFYPGDFTFV
jgi:hypothetical protein